VLVQFCRNLCLKKEPNATEQFPQHALLSIRLVKFKQSKEIPPPKRDRNKKEKHLQFRLIQGAYRMRKLAALPDHGKGEELGGSGLGSETFGFPTSLQILKSTGSIPANKEADCTTHGYPRPASLESSTCVCSRKGTAFSHITFQAVHEAATNKEWNNEQTAETERKRKNPTEKEKKAAKHIFTGHSVTGKPA